MSVMPRGCITFSTTFGMPEYFCKESILFDVTEVTLPFNAILGRPALYQFIAVAHYGYPVLKIPSSNGVLKIRGDYDAGVSALEKLQALAAPRDTAVEPGDQDPTPSSSHQRGSALVPHVQPSAKEDIPVKTIQIRAKAAQTTSVSGDLDIK
jgi:hypothetical protein